VIKDLLHARPNPVAEADICIVGAGAAGILLASELLRFGKYVVLLEGGGAEHEEAAQDPYRSEVAGLKHNGVHEGRFRVKGGTTTRWGGQILEYDELDFGQRDWVPGSGWPFAKTELAPFYKRAMELEGLGRLAGMDEEAWDASMWRDLGQPVPDFGELQPYFTRWLPEPDFARLHRAAIEDDPRLELWLHANAVELLLDGERAAGVRCRTQTGIEATFRASEYVFCMGSIESSRFFLQPRAGGLPWNRSGLLGRHFQDHIDANAATIKPRDAKRFHALFDNVFLRGLKFQPKLRLNSKGQEQQKTLNVGASILFVSDADQRLGAMKTTAKHLLRGRFGKLKFGDLTSLFANLPTLTRQSLRYTFEHRAWNPPDANILLRVHCEQEPLSESNITLADTRDSLGLLRTRLDWRISNFELDTIRTFTYIAQQALDGIVDVIPNPALAHGRDFIAHCDDGLHHMGGMRMAASEADGIVDPNLRLHGTRNVHICSAAVYPTSGYSNPTHTLLALAMRLAVHLR
jgi:choline dehydrogenase-like flavoprotein